MPRYCSLLYFKKQNEKRNKNVIKNKKSNETTNNIIKKKKKNPTESKLKNNNINGWYYGKGQLDRFGLNNLVIVTASVLN